MTNKAVDWLLKGGYWGMSYRGRFLFDPWMMPAMSALLWWLFRPSDIVDYWFIGVLVVVGVSSARYNYILWQGQVRDRKPVPDPRPASDRDLD